MTIMLDDYPAFRRKALSVVAEAQQAKGALKQLMARLKKEFGVDSVEGAEKLLKGMKRKEARLAKKFNEMRRSFEREYRRELKKAGRRVVVPLPDDLEDRVRRAGELKEGQKGVRRRR